MSFRLLISFILFCFTTISTFSQGIHGRITNDLGEPVAFANIYVPQLSTGTSSNIDGFYELKLPEGNWKILFQYLGYQTQSRDMSIIKSTLEINIELSTQNYRIPEIKVLASGEDPAYYIMRRAIALAPYYRKQVSKYSCKVYLKGSGIFENIPLLLKKQIKKSGLKENQPFVMETVSQIDFELPDQINQKVLAMRSSGKQNSTSPMGMITNNLYDAEKYGVVSPVGKNAMKAYNFRLDGVFEDQGRTINKIRVTPKIKGNDVFSGYIYIADLFWNIHSADLFLHIPMTDVQVHQVYAEVNKNTWMPVSLDFDMNFSGFGLKMKYRYVASISDYKTTLNPAFDHTFLDKVKDQQNQDQQIAEKIFAENKEFEAKEATKAQQRINILMEKPELNNRETKKLNHLIETEAKRNSPPEPLEIKSSFQVSQKQVNNDSAYWSNLRPIPLTEKERSSFAEKDSFIRVSSTPEYQDSIRNSKRKFRMKHLLVGKTYDYSIDSIHSYKRFSIPNLTDPGSLSFNSVDGLRIELPFSYQLSDSTGHLLRISPILSYAFARQKPDVALTIQKRLNGLTNSWITLEGGSTTPDYNLTSGLSVMTNDFYTLWLKENYKRFFRRDYLKLTASRDLINGLNLNAGITFSDNSPLQNHSTYSFIKYDHKVIMPNIPVNNSLLPEQLENHQSLIGQINMEFTPQNHYRIRNGAKIYAGSKFPTYILNYKGGFSGLLGSDSRFDQITIGIRQKLDFGINDHFSYKVNAGSFLNASKIYFEDFQHFNNQSTGFLFSSYENSFRLLPFYENATSKQFLEAHTTWETRRLLLKQLPVLRNSSITENLFMNYLKTPGRTNYLETGYGIKNLFLLLNIEAVAGFENGKFRSAGFKFSLNLK